MTTRAVVVIGQSNERGKRFADDVALDTGGPLYARRGPLCEDPIGPAGSLVGTVGGAYYGSIWPMLSEHLYDAGLPTYFRNAARGNTSLISDWCGASEGSPLDSEDGGWDPNGYIDTALDSIKDLSYTPKVAFICTGNNDAGADASQEDFAQAYINIADYLLANGIDQIVVGLTGLRGGNRTWGENTGTPAIQDVLDNYSDDSVIAGPNLTTLLGENFGTTDGTHYDQRTIELSAQHWRDALLTAWR